MKSNLSRKLKEAMEISGESLEAIVVGIHDSRHWGSERLPDEGIILSPEDGIKKIDEDYDDEFGSADCYPFFAWTKNRIYFVREYDGSTALSWIPRNPIPVMPSWGRTICDD